MSNIESKRQHYVPQFYLRQFADANGRVRVYSRDGEKAFQTQIKNIAAENAFYTFTDHPTGDIYIAEHNLAKLESDFRDVLMRLTAEQFPPSNIDRFRISMMLALQLLRTPATRQMLQAVFGSTLQKRFANTEIIPGIKGIPDGLVPILTKDTQISQTFEFALKFIPAFFTMRWTLGKRPRPAFITSDHPIALFHSQLNTSELTGIGIRTCEKVFFPLDRQHVLIMSWDGEAPKRPQFLPPQYVDTINRTVAEWSLDWIIEHPEDDVARHVLPRSRRPIAYKNGQPVYASPAKP